MSSIKMLGAICLFAFPLAAEAYCCFYPQTPSRCSNCQSIAQPQNWCSANEQQCVNDCGHVWCDDADDDDDDSTDDTANGDDAPPSSERVTGTYTTGYWDCCKPSCSWPGKGNVDHPVYSCSASSGAQLSNANVPSACGGGDAASCNDYQPFEVTSNLTFGFTAAAVGGVSGRNGDENCGQCYELVWTDEQYSWGGGAHPDIVGKRFVGSYHRQGRSSRLSMTAADPRPTPADQRDGHNIH